LLLEALEERVVLSGGPAGDSFATAALIALAADNSGSQPGTIATSGQVDFYQFVAQRSGQLAIQQHAAPGGSLDSLLTVYDSTQTEIVQDDDGGGGHDSALAVNVVQNQTYFVTAAASPFAFPGSGMDTGAYTLTFLPDDTGHDFASAVALTLPAGGSVSQPATIAAPGDVDFFQFVAPQTGFVYAQQNAASGSSLVGLLTAYDATQTLIAQGDQGVSGNSNNQVHFAIVQGQSYYLAVAASPSTFTGTSGAFTLKLIFDDFGSDFATAQPITLAPDGSGSQAGVIEDLSNGPFFQGPDDVDFFQFVAPQTESLVVRQAPAPRSGLASSLTVYDDQQNVLGQENATTGFPTAPLVVQVVQGQTYFVAAAAARSLFPTPGTTGGYVLTLAPRDTSGLDFATAPPLTLAADGSGTQGGDIQLPGDAKFFRLVAPVTATLLVQENPAPDSTLQSSLSVYTGARQLIGTDTAGFLAHDSQVQFNVLKGQTYYVKAGADSQSAFGGETGSFTLTFSMFRQLGDNFVTAPFIPLNGAGAGGMTGSIAPTGDGSTADVFRLVPSTTGILAVEQDAAPGSGLDSYLSVFDDWLQPVASNDDMQVQNPNSRVEFPVVAGFTYYLQATASPYANRKADSGAYQLTVTPVRETVGSTFAAAQPLTLDGSGGASQSGAIQLPGDVNVFRLVAATTGLMTARLNADPQSVLDPYLQVFDQGQHLLSLNDDGDHGYDSLVRFSVVAGQTYYLEAGGFPAAASADQVGAYTLTVGTSPLGPGDAGHTLVDAPLITLNQPSDPGLSGSITVAARPDTYQFVAPLSAGPVIVTLTATGAGDLVPFLDVFDSSGNQLATDYDKERLFKGARTSQVQFNIVIGRTYVIQAAGFRSSTGSYRLTVVNGDDFGNDFASAHLLQLAPDGSGSQAGTIETPGDVDFFQFVAPITGQMQIQLAPSGSNPQSNLQGQLTVYDGTQAQIAQDAGFSSSSLVTVALVQGQTYYVETAASSLAGHTFAGGTTGSYLLTFAVNDAGTDFASATPLSLAPDGTAQRAGIIASSSVGNFYQFMAPFTGALSIRQDAIPGSSLDSFLTVFDGTQTPIGRGDNSGGGLNSLLTVNVVQGQTYYVEAAAAPPMGSFGGGTTGAYRLTFAPIVDDTGEDFASAVPIALAADNSGVQAGTISVPGDVDFYQFVPSRTGELLVRMDPAPGSVLFSFLTVFDSAQTQIAQDSGGGGPFTSLVIVPVIAGQTYYVQAGLAPGVALTGGYLLTFAPHDVGDNFTTARPIPLAADGSGSQAGAIAMPGETDFFQLLAPLTGRLLVEQAAAAPGNLDSFLKVYDSTQTVIAQDDNSGGGLDSLVSFLVVAGQTYYLQAGAAPLPSSSGAPTGHYVLTIAATAAGSDFSTAHLLTLDADGSGTQAGSIQLKGEEDFYQLVATRTGILAVEQAAAAGSKLDSFLTVYNGAQQQIAQDDNSGGFPNSLTSFDVVAGQTYFVKAGASPNAGTTLGEGATGAYLLTFRSVSDDSGSDFATAQLLTLAPDGSGQQQGNIAVAGDVDFYQFVSPVTARLRIQQQAVQGSNLDSFLSVYDSSQALLGSDDNSGRGTDSLLDVNVVQGQTYYVTAAASPNASIYSALPTRSGPYLLSFFVPYDDGADDDFHTAAPLTLTADGSATRSGTIGTPQDVDTFSFEAPLSGTLQVAVQGQAAGAGALASYLAVFDSSQTFLQSAEATPEHPDPALELTVSAGQSYYVQVESASLPVPGRQQVGPYVLTLQTTVSQDADGVGSTFATAQAIPLDSAGFGSQTGNIDTLSDVDVFKITAPRTVRVTIADNAGQNTQALETFLSVYNAAGDLIGQDGAGGSRPNSQVTIDLIRGRTYYIQAAASPRAFLGTTGPYTLTIAPRADDFGHDFATALPIPLNPDGSGSQGGSIEVPRDADYFQFVAPFTGLLTVRQSALPGSALNSFLSVYDDTQALLGQNDDLGATRDSLVQVPVVQGQTYYLRAAASPEAVLGSPAGPGPGAPVGDYLLNFAADFGIDFDHAQAVVLDQTDSAHLDGLIDVVGRTPIYRFVAPRTEKLAIRQEVTTSGDLDSFLSVYNGARQLLTSDDNSGGGLNSRLLLDVVQGQTYYVEAAASPQAATGSRTGPYTLTIAPLTDALSSFATAFPLAVAADGSASQPGAIQQPGDVDYFRYVAAQTGELAVRVNALAFNGLFPTLTIYDGGGTLIVQEPPAANLASTSSLLSFEAVRGQVYFIQVNANDTLFLPSFLPDSAEHVTGEYILSVGPFAGHDPLGDSIDTATPVTVPPDDSVSVSGEIKTAGAADFVQFTAPVTGLMTVRIDPVEGPSLGGQISVFDSARRLLATASNLLTSANLAEFDVVQGQSYYVETAATPFALNSFTETATGGYLLTFAPYLDEVPDNFQEAQSIPMSPTGYGEASGTLQGAHEQDTFQLTATVTGKIQVEQYTAPGSALASRVRVYDGNQNLLAQGDNGRVGLNDVAAFDAVAGQTYFVRATADPSAAPAASTGRYIVFFGPDAGGTFQDPQPLPLPPSGSGNVPGTIPVPDHQDIFRFVAPVSGTLILQTNVDPDSNLKPVLEVFDAEHQEIAGDNGSGSAQVLLNKGDSYFLEVANEQLDVGSYNLTFAVDAFGLITPATTFGEFKGVTVAIPPPPGGSIQAQFDIFGVTASPTGSPVALLPLAESALAVVATLVTGGVPGGNPAAANVIDNPGEENRPVLPNQGAGPNAAPARDTPLLNLQLGLDGALEQAIPEARERLLDPDREPPAAEKDRAAADPLFRTDFLVNACEPAGSRALRPHDLRRVEVEEEPGRTARGEALVVAIAGVKETPRAVVEERSARERVEEPRNPGWAGPLVATLFLSGLGQAQGPVRPAREGGRWRQQPVRGRSD
jgi:hypothetical protein